MDINLRTECALKVAEVDSPQSPTSVLNVALIVTHAHTKIQLNALNVLSENSYIRVSVSENAHQEHMLTRRRLNVKHVLKTVLAVTTREHVINVHHHL